MKLALFTAAFDIFATIAGSDLTPCKLRNPSNMRPGLSCSVRGRLSRFEVFPRYEDYGGQPQIFGSAAECANMCAGRVWSPEIYGLPKVQVFSSLSYCHSFKFNKQTKECFIGNVYVADSKVKLDNRSHDQFYDFDCYDCGEDLCLQQYGHNAIDNGGFEQELFGPWFANGAKSGNGKNTTGSFSNYRPGLGNESHPYVTQIYNDCGVHANYAFSFDYQVYGGNSTPKIQLNAQRTGFFTEGQYIINGDQYAKSGIYRTVRGVASGGEGGYLQFEMEPNSAKFFIDNVQVVRYEPSALQLPTHDSQSLVSNGGFETGELEPWISTSSHPNTGVVRSPGLSGSSYGLFFEEGSYGQVSQILAVHANAFYYFSMDVGATKSGGPSCTATMYARNFTGGGDETYYTASKSFYLFHKGSKVFHTYIYITNDQVNLTVSVDCQPLTQHRRAGITIDNIQLRPVSSAPFTNVTEKVL